MSNDDNKHPNSRVDNENSQANLKEFEGDWAREAQRRSVESRKRNKAQREELRQRLIENLDYFEQMGDIEFPSGEQVLETALAQAITNNDMDEATRLAAILLPYQKPKLQAQRLTVKDDASDMTDAELNELVKQMGMSVEDREDDE